MPEIWPRLPDTGPAYWDLILKERERSSGLDPWQQYMQTVYRRLIAAWLPERRQRPPLKTDLFEEAVSDYPVLPELGPQCLGMDHALEIVLAARQRLGDGGPNRSFLVCDLRRISLRSGSLPAVFSGSSLDHFSKNEDFGSALKELSRVLAPGGTLILTLDNPSNPVVWLRNRLPFSGLNRLGLVPYYVGRTCSLKEARTRLEAGGFTVTHGSAVVHAPRIFAIWLSALLVKVWGNRSLRWFESFLEKWEVLQRWPTRFQTGYYIALRAVKCRN